MRYNKPPLTITGQIDKLKARGLKFENEKRAKDYLYNISFYRLRAYTYPFQDNQNPDHPFIKDVSFEQILDLYLFDRRIRLLLLNAIEKIEVAFRTRVIYEYSMKYESHWFQNISLFHDIDNFHKNNIKIKKELRRSNETFIKHYYEKYDSPELPPAWMTLEVISLGTLGKLYSNLKRNKQKNKVAVGFGLKKADMLENWIHAIGDLRNICAHHGRVWNRRFTTRLKIPYNTNYRFIDNTRIDNNKLYALLCAINYIIRIIAPNSDYVRDLKALINKCPLANCKMMGIPENWEEEEIWK